MAKAIYTCVDGTDLHIEVIPLVCATLIITLKMQGSAVNSCLNGVTTFP